ncbi:MAG TPA: glycosyltransferase [Acetobacteraceae bacterium]|nr:glycosyltransferase [Acetobacteraceae bacterium]
MRLAVLGKRGSITGWTESTAAGLRAAGNEVLHLVTRDPRLAHGLERLLPRARLLQHRLARFRPELILLPNAFAAPLGILRAVRAAAGDAPVVGWMGDGFGEESRAKAACCDLIGYTDTGLLARHHALGFASRACFLPHAVDPARALPPGRAARSEMMVFVASPTPRRAAIVRAVERPLRLIGENWDRMAGPPHNIEPRRIPPGEVAAIYAAHRAVLNIHHERNAVSGLNQRSFEPYLCGAAVVSDMQPDLPLCFVPGEEVLVWADAVELNALYARLGREPGLAARTAEAGRRRIIAEHSFAARLHTLAAALGLRKI